MCRVLQVTKGTYQLKLLARIPIHNPNFLKAGACHTNTHAACGIARFAVNEQHLTQCIRMSKWQ